jgi:flagellar biosynthesis protein FlhB
VADDVERTEEATPKRREQAQKEGQLAISQDAFIFANLFAVSAVLLVMGPASLRLAIATTQELWRPRYDLDISAALELLGVTGRAIAQLLLPVLAVAVIAGVAIGQLQTRGNIATKRLSPRWSRLSPRQNATRVFKQQAVIELPKSLAKITVVGAVLWLAVQSRIGEYLGLLYLPLPSIVAFQLGVVIKAYLMGCVALLAIALVDYAYQHYQNERGLRMSRTEVREERRQAEGDPLVKSRLRSLQLERARSRMMAAVPAADVVVTNPEHISIALQYDRSAMPAPKVVARGAGLLALRIREIAVAHGVAIVENRPLARSLYGSVRVGDVIPERLYRAVAELLAYVYKLDPAKGKTW